MHRYTRQARFGPLGPDGQTAIEAAGAVIVGCGALGTVAADMLARAGIGRLRLVDRDVVELTNLHRQALLTEDDARDGLPKAVATAARLGSVRSDLVVEAVVEDLDGANARELLRGASVVLDGTDNFEARHVLNEACLDLGLPWVHASCLGALAVAWPIVPGGACYACLVPDAPGPGEVATCETEGILGPAVHAAAAMQVAEAMKLLAGRREALLPGPASLDTWTGRMARVRAERSPSCRACAARDWRYLGRPRDAAAIACGRGAVQIAATGAAADLPALRDRLRGEDGVVANRFLVRFSAGGHEVTVFASGRVLVRGTRDIARARAIAARYLGP